MLELWKWEGEVTHIVSCPSYSLLELFPLSPPVFMKLFEIFNALLRGAESYFLTFLSLRNSIMTQQCTHELSTKSSLRATKHCTHLSQKLLSSNLDGSRRPVLDFRSASIGLSVHSAGTVEGSNVPAVTCHALSIHSSWLALCYTLLLIS